MTKTDVATLILSIAVFWLSVLGRRSWALPLLILAIPFGSRNVAWSTTSFLVPVTAVAVLGSKLGSRFRSVPEPAQTESDPAGCHHRVPGSDRSSRADWVLVLFATCHVASLLSFALRPFPKEISLLESSPLISMLQLVGAMIGGSLLYRLILEQNQTPADSVRAIAWFVSTVLVLAAVVTASDLLGLPVPDFFLPWVTVGLPNGTWTTIRGGLHSGMGFAGFHGFVENFGEYLVIVFAMAWGLVATPKVFHGQFWLGLAGMAFALLFAVPSACKAVPILIMMFWLTQIALAHGAAQRRLVWAAAVVVLGLALSWPLLARTPLGLRLGVLVERSYGVWRGRVGLDTIPFLLGREGVERLWIDVIPVAGLVGVGPVIVHGFEGSILPYHNLYYQVWLDYGVAGLATLVIVLVAILRRLARLRRSTDPILAGLGIIFLGLLPLLMLEQIKVSAFRLASGVYTAWFLLGSIASLHRLARDCKPHRPQDRGCLPQSPLPGIPRYPFCGRDYRSAVRRRSLMVSTNA